SMICNSPTSRRRPDIQPALFAPASTIRAAASMQESMQRIHHDKWAKALGAGCLRAVAPLLLGAAVLGTGCGDFEESEAIDASGHDTLEQDGSPAVDDEYLEIADDQPNTLVDVGPEDVAGHYIVMLKDGVDPQVIADAFAAKPQHVYHHVISGFAG